MIQGTLTADDARFMKTSVKDRLRRLHAFYARTVHGFDAPALRASLRLGGVAPGDTVFVHSAFNAFHGFSGRPSEILDALEALVGAEGTILMPSLPFSGSALTYVKSGAVTDIARSPSRTGLLTELFRRQKGTLRSVHPTHPILARGARAAAMIDGHLDAGSPCGAGSPFARLLETSGKILFLGVDIRSMTFFHYLEERFESRIVPSPLTAEVFDVPVRTGGETLTAHTRLYNPELSGRRNIGVLLPELRRRGGITTGKVGLLPWMLVRTDAAQQAFEAVLDAGKTFYDRR
jgi:aminoglycoside 3-N-acetyltransferase